MNNSPRPSMPIREQRGFSLIELMIAMAMGLIITLALLQLLSSTAQTNREQFKAAQQIENGRYATEVVSSDIRLAGFYGEFAPAASSLTTLPDPCDLSLITGTPTLSLGDTSTASPLAFHIQGYRAGSTSSYPTLPTACATWLNVNNVKPGSDILVIRRLDTKPLIDELALTSTMCDKPAGPTACTAAATINTATPVEDVLYVQSDVEKLFVFTGDNIAIDKTTMKSTFSSRKDFSGGGSTTLAPFIRRLQVHIYFVAPCRSGTGSGGVCTSADDSVPTLKRLELGADTFTIVPLVDGIEFFKIRYGVDAQDSGTLTQRTTNRSYDGFADYLKETPTLASGNNEWGNVVMAEVRVVARNPDPSYDLADDTKTYDLGGGQTYVPSGTAAKYRRHLFSSNVYIMNAGGRREF